MRPKDPQLARFQALLCMLAENEHDAPSVGEFTPLSLELEELLISLGREALSRDQDLEKAPLTGRLRQLLLGHLSKQMPPPVPDLENDAQLDSLPVLRPLWLKEFWLWKRQRRTPYS